MTAGFLKDEDKKAEKMKDVPMGRPSQPEEQAGMAILLLSDRASCEFTLMHCTIVHIHRTLIRRTCYSDRYYRISNQHRWRFDHLVERTAQS